MGIKGEEFLECLTKQGFILPAGKMQSSVQNSYNKVLENRKCLPV